MSLVNSSTSSILSEHYLITVHYKSAWFSSHKDTIFLLFLNYFKKHAWYTEHATFSILVYERSMYSNFTFSKLSSIVNKPFVIYLLTFQNILLFYCLRVHTTAYVELHTNCRGPSVLKNLRSCLLIYYCYGIKKEKHALTSDIVRPMLVIVRPILDLSDSIITLLS